MVEKVLRVAVGANDETMVNRAGLTHWSRQEGKQAVTRNKEDGVGGAPCYHSPA
ncbi:uncharacterized protein PHALS_00466 [Plasmopara halstedii]|uniref:Uncharacterized protein n=1 Tax=Plasmopara halstedii TaxID=4781 RepID=A0A0P1AT42_PLAHL|nr:uncharacterized protein PHALS_00466 [Plasmopara halstedii]CEG44270.1 hypothetical protein PHALS_00466 [Plasmopara halstedii]|eukprot:XP_024580639.1 hypothetical protein PHALS_00466 [Plasmopara halstedii]